MNFKCKNCGASMVFSPKTQTMLCPYCSQLNSHEIVGDSSLTTCPSCGGELTPGTYTSASKCPFCDNNIIFDERISGPYKPDTIIPFKLDKEDAVAAIEKECTKRIFAPASFLHEKTLKDMSGYYVPFFLYDYDANATYRGTGTRIRKWSSGNYDYVETSYYNVARQMHAKYDNVPADASIEMPDENMDLIEPYDYQQLLGFDPKYLSGFFGEVYNNNASVFESRAKQKAISSAKALMQASLTGYTTLTPVVDNTEATMNHVDFALLPVWIYKYKWGGNEYPVYVNGQSGKVVGVTPVSKLKVLLYALTSGGIVLAIIEMILKMLEVL